LFDYNLYENKICKNRYFQKNNLKIKLGGIKKMSISYVKKVREISKEIADKYESYAMCEVDKAMIKELDYQIDNGLNINDAKTVISKAKVDFIDEEFFYEIINSCDVNKMLNGLYSRYSNIQEFVESNGIKLPSSILVGEILERCYSWVDDEPDISYIGMKDGEIQFRCSNYTDYIVAIEEFALELEHCNILNEVGRKTAMDYIEPIMDEIIERCNKYYLKEIDSSVFEFDANVVNQECAIRFFSRDDVQAIYKRGDDLNREIIFEDGKDPAQHVMDVMTEYFENKGIDVKCLGQGRHYDSIKFHYRDYYYDLEESGLLPYKLGKKTKKNKTKEEFEEIENRMGYRGWHENIAQKLTSPLKEILKNADNPNDLGKVEITVKLSQAEFDFVNAINLDNLIKDFYEKSEDVKYTFDIV
jgi:hypothetical protein